MSFFINQSCCLEQTNKKYVTEILFYTNTKQFNSLLTFKFFIGIHCKFNLPINAIKLDIESNIIKAENINLNKEHTDEHYTWLSGSLDINIQESNILNKPFQNLHTFFKANFKINDEAFNKANIDISNSEYLNFINELYTWNNKVTNNNYFNNIYDLKQLNISNISNKYINNYDKYFDLPIDFYNFHNIYNPFTPQILISEYKINQKYLIQNLFSIQNKINYELNFEDLNLNVKYFVDNKEKNINFKNIKSKIKTNFDFIKNDIIYDERNGWEGIYIPKKTKINILFWFKYNFSYYFIKFNFFNDKDLFSSNKNNNALFSWDVY